MSFENHVLTIFFRYVDMLNLMTYDMHGGSFDDKTGHNAPLKAHPSETGNQTYFNVVRLLLLNKYIAELSDFYMIYINPEM